MPSCAPFRPTTTNSSDQKNTAHATRRVIFPRRMFPMVRAIEEHFGMGQDAELISTDVAPKASATCLERGYYALDESQSPNEQTLPLPLDQNENQAPTLPESSHEMIPKSFPIATPPRRVSLSSRSPLGRYQQTTSSAFYLDAPENKIPRVSSEPNKPLVSILREASFVCMPHCFNIDSMSSERSQSLNHVESFLSKSPPRITHIRRSRSEPNNSPHSKIHFDPRIWIREFERSPEERAETWYSSQDMNRFRRHAMALIVSQDRQTASKLLQKSSSRAVFTHAALAEESGQSELVTALRNDRYRTMVAQQEMRHVLIVDPHDICVRLFERAFTTLLPHIKIVGVTSAQQAMGQLACQKFDVILVEERLQTTFHLQKLQHSGSDFFRTINTIASRSLWIGVSAHLPKDRAALEASGVDLCWNKPPPKMSVDLRNDLLRRLLVKRGHDEFAQELFGIC